MQKRGTIMKLKKNIKAAENIAEDTLVLTPSGLLTFLVEIEELEGENIYLSETDDGIVVTIGDSSYTLKSPAESEISIDSEAVDEIDEINEVGYDDIAEDLDESFENSEEIEGGIIKELVKTLAVGGLVRLTKDAIMKS